MVDILAGIAFHLVADSPDCTVEEDIGLVAEDSLGCTVVVHHRRNNRCWRRLLDRHRSVLGEVVADIEVVRRPTHCQYVASRSRDRRATYVFGHGVG